MKNEIRKFTHESLQDAHTIQALLSALKEGINKGELSFDDDDGAITLNPSGLLKLKAAASHNDATQCAGYPCQLARRQYQQARQTAQIPARLSIGSVGRGRELQCRLYFGTMSNSGNPDAISRGCASQWFCRDLMVGC